MFDFDLHKFYEVTLPDGITDSGIDQVCQMLYASIQKNKTKGDDDPGYRKVNTYAHYGYYKYIVPDGWSWQYTASGKGKYVGTITRRLSKYVKETFGYNLSEGELSTIGSLARDNSTPKTTSHIDFDDALDWQAGDFGDRGSCFWGRNKGALLLLRKREAQAVRMWREDHTKGTGRAWLLPPTIHNGGNFMVVLNGCGGAGCDMYEYSTLYFARVLAAFWGLEYHSVYFNGGDCSNKLYGNAYIIGHLPDISGIRDFRLDWPNEFPDYGYNDEDDEPEYRCRNCDYRDDDQDSFNYNGNDDCYCHDCYNEMYAQCTICYEEVYIEDAVNIDGEYYCDYHRRMRLTECGNCNEYCKKADATDVNGTTLCSDCYANEGIRAQYTGEEADD